MTTLVASSLCRVIPPWPRRNLRNIHTFVIQLNVAVHPFGAGYLQPVSIVALREIRFVCPPRESFLACAPIVITLARTSMLHTSLAKFSVWVDHLLRSLRCSCLQR